MEYIQRYRNTIRYELIFYLKDEDKTMAQVLQYFIKDGVAVLSVKTVRSCFDYFIYSSDPYARAYRVWWKPAHTGNIWCLSVTSTYEDC